MKTTALFYSVVGITFLALLVKFGYAHDGAVGWIAEGDGGFTQGFFHPLFGEDHFLAMLSVGIFSAIHGGRSIWGVPALFVGFMVVGGMIAMSDFYLPLVEVCIAFSVLALGLAVAAGTRVPLLLGSIFVAAFGMCHGHAHGLEMPHMASPVFYSLGFVLCTSMIHLLGVAVGHFGTKTVQLAQGVRYLGAFIGGIGFQFLWELIKFGN